MASQGWLDGSKLEGSSGVKDSGFVCLIASSADVTTDTSARPIRSQIYGRSYVEWLADAAMLAGARTVARLASPMTASQVKSDGSSSPDQQPTECIGSSAAYVLTVPSFIPMPDVAILRDAMNQAARFGTLERPVLVRMDDATGTGVPSVAVACTEKILAGLMNGAGARMDRLTHFDWVLSQLSARGIQSGVLHASDSSCQSIATPIGYSRALVKAQNRIQLDLMRQGVIIEHPMTTQIDFNVTIGAGTTIRSGSVIEGKSVIGTDCIIGPNSTIIDSNIGDRSTMIYTVCKESSVGARSNVGPFSWIRSASEIGTDCRVGPYVEVSRSRIGDRTAIPHVAGVLDATIGADCNFAGGSATVNGVGDKKDHTNIGDNVEIGAGTILVAPVDVGEGARTAASTVVTRSVPAGMMAASRVRQRNLPLPSRER